MNAMFYSHDISIFDSQTRYKNKKYNQTGHLVMNVDSVCNAKKLCFI
jgi:hypothetical protein